MYNDSRKPIKNAKIIDEITKETSYTNDSGIFSMISSGKIEISASGFISKNIKIYATDQDIKITLYQIKNQLDQVFIKSNAIPKKLKNTSESITILKHHQIQKGNTLELHPILNQVPGVFMQSGTLNTNRITIRGIGARNLFGTANIRAYYGDIPLTDGNGASTIEDLELNSISEIEIHKGPAASSFGVGLGGTIILHPKKIKSKTIETSLSSIIGSYGLKRILANAAYGKKENNFNITYSNSHMDGYRQNNEFNKNVVTATSNLQINNQNNISTIATYSKLKANIPSSLNEEDFNYNPRQTAFTWGQSKAFEDYDYILLGITLKHTYNNNLSQNTSVFSTFRSNYEPRPFNILKEKSTTFGIRTRFLGDHNIASRKIKWTIGGELFFDFYNQKTFENLYQDFPEDTGSVQGNQLSFLKEKRNYYNVFAETSCKISAKLNLNLGVNLNQTFYTINDQFLFDNEDSSGDFDFNPILSPKLGLNYLLNKKITLFSNIAHGFSTPTTSETLLPDGIFNPDIKPEIGWNYEIGTRFKFVKNKLTGSLSLYSLQVRDLLIARRTTEDNFFAINAGKTEHNGIETSLRYTMLQTSKFDLSFSLNLTLNDFKFKDFIDLDEDFSGNDLTGTPKYVSNFSFDIINQKGIYGNISLQTVGKIPANDANTIYNDTFELLHGKIGYKNDINPYFSYSVFIGANNILNTHYASQLQINARGFGGNLPRYFYPGLPFNTYGGINIKYRL